MSERVTGVILAGGSGLRLDPISTPKPLVRVGTRPLIIWAITSLQRLGIQDIWLAVGKHGDSIQKEIIGNSQITSQIHILRLPSDSRTKVETVTYAVSSIAGPLLITPCDLIFERYPVAAAELASVDPGSCTAFAAPPPREPAGVPAHELGIYLVGEDAKKDFLVAQRLAPDAATLYPSMKEHFKSARAELKVTDPGEWHDVNSPIDKIRAEIFIKQNYKPPAPPERVETRDSSRPERQTYRFDMVKKKMTEVVVQANILDQLWEYDIIPHANAGSNHYLVMDSALYEIVGKKIEAGFQSRGYSVRAVIVPLGEEVKTIDEYWKLMLEILAYGVDRQSIIMNLGGGAINNVAGFIAATLFRGVALYHLPTTLLAQLDSTIDIKHAINTPYGKNLVGSFYGADKVVIDPVILKHLPEEHIVNGLSEAIKHALVQDVAFLRYFDEYKGGLADPEFLEKVIQRTIDLKVQCMGTEPDGGKSDGIKDYGHSLGHTLEQYTGYELHHGQAIAVGMCLSAEISRILNVTSEREVDMHYRIFRKYRLPTCITPDVSIEDFLLVLRYDKTYMQGCAYMGLIAELGRLWHDNGKYQIPIDLEIVGEALRINQKKFMPDQPVRQMSYVKKI